MGFFKSLLKLIAIILVIIAIILIIYAAIVFAFSGAASATLMTAIGVTTANGLAWTLLLVGIGGLLVASIVSPEGFNEAMARVSNGLNTTAEVIGGAAGSLIGATAGGLVSAFKAPLIWLAGGYVGYKYFTRPKADDSSPSSQSSDIRETGPELKTSVSSEQQQENQNRNSFLLRGTAL